VLGNENGRLQSKGLAWEYVGNRLANTQELRQMLPHGATPLMVLTWLEDVRPAYEASHPTARAVSRELSPLPLADSLTKMQYAIRREQGGGGGMAGGSGGPHMAAWPAAAAAAPPGGLGHVAPSAPFFAPPSLLQGPPSYDSLAPVPPPSAPPAVLAPVSKSAQIEGATTAGGGTDGTVAALSNVSPTFCFDCGARSEGKKFCGDCGTQLRT
jgi:hypothetical protein